MGNPSTPPCWQIVQYIKLKMYACNYITFVIMRRIHIDFFYFLTHFTIEIMNLAILRHLVTPHWQPLAPSPHMSPWLVLPVIFEGESMAESETISFLFHFFFIFFSPFLLIFMPLAILAILAILQPPMGDPSTPYH